MGQGNIIGKPNLPATTGSKGLWNLREQYAASRDSKWPGYDPQWDKTTLLLKTALPVGDAFIDSSPNNFTVTKTGDTVQTTSTPYAPYWSNYFDGSGDSLNLASSAALNPAAGDFTFECWINPTNWTNTYSALLVTLVNTGLWIGKNGSNFVVRTAYVADVLQHATLPTVGAWTHVVVVRSGTTLSLFYNGTRVATVTNSTTFVQGPTYIGSDDGGGGSNFAGHISNLRFVKGTAVYNPTLTTLTVPTAPLTAIANTQLLTCQDNRFIDRSTNNFTLTRAGDVAVSRFSPFAWAWSAASGGSGYFDGTDLRLPSSSLVTPGTGDFTVEGWVNMTAVSETNGIFQISDSGYFNGVSGVAVQAYGLYWYTYANGDIFGGTVLATLSQWYHFALVRSSGTTKLYVNGVAIISYADTRNYTGTFMGIGNIYDPNPDTRRMRGYVSNFRYVRGTAVYTANFTPPTSPVTAIAGTSVLLNFTNAAHSDTSGLASVVRQVGTTVSRGRVAPSAELTSVGFNGGTEYLTVSSPSGQLGAGDFTVEAWVYPFSRISNLPTVWGNYTTWGAGAFGLWVGHSSHTTNFSVGINGTYPALVSTSTITYNTWTHLAVVRSNGVIRLYVNGVSEGGTFSSTATLNQGAGSSWVSSLGDSIGSSSFNGFISNLRVERSARYTASFTPDRTPITTTANTALALNQTVDVWDETRKSNLTSTGTVVATPAMFTGSALSLNGSQVARAYSGTRTTDFGFGTGDFCIEAWVYPTAVTGADRCLWDTRASAGDAGMVVFINSSGQLSNYTSNAIRLTSTLTLVANTWQHVAVVRVAGTLAYFINGQPAGAVAYTTTIDCPGQVSIGIRFDNAAGFSGQMDELRVTKSNGRYVGAFSPTTAPFDRDWEPPYNDTLVTSNVLQVKSIDLPGATNNVFRDDSTNAFTVTRNGDVTQGSFSPYIPRGYWSNSIAGPGNHLALSANSAFDHTGDVTVEAWVCRTDSAAGYQFFWGGSQPGFMLLGAQANRFCLDIYYAGSVVWSPDTIVNNRWYHVAGVKTGNTARLYVDGVLKGSATMTGQTNSATLYVGNLDGYGWPGYVSNLRFVKGTSVYTSNFTPPTAPLTAISGTSLLTCQDNRFIDRSTNNFTLTRTGDVQVSRLDPFPLAVPVTTAPVTVTTENVLVFDGNGDYARVNYTAAFDLSGSDWTMEAWFKTSSFSTSMLLVSKDTYGSNYDWGINIASSTTINLYTAGTASVLTATVPAMSTGQWHHVAFVRQSGTNRIYLNGVQYATNTMGISNSSQSYVTIGCASWNNPNGLFNGLLRSLRIVKGTAVYQNGTTFTPPATLTNITNTSLLVAGTLADGSSNNYTVTAFGDTRATTESTYDTTRQASALYGGSGYFDGSGDYLTIPNNAAFSFGAPSGNANDFTVEFWTFPTTTTVTAPVHTTYSGNNFWGFAFNKDDGNANVVGMTNFFLTDSFRVQSASGALRANEWSHIAATRSGTTVRLFINGTQVASGTSSINPAPTGALQFGRDTVLGRDYAGYIANARIVKGSAVYTANFTPPTSPVTAISGTSLLLNFDNAGVYDATAQRNLTFYGDSKTATAVTQFGQSTMVFDGTGDYITTPTSPNLGFSTGDFTVEFWMRVAVAPGSGAKHTLLDFRPSGGGAVPHTMYVANSSGTLYLGFFNGSADVTSSSQPVTVGTWSHVAYCRSAGTLRIFVNGAQAYSAAHTTDYQTTRMLTIGASAQSGIEAYNGYLYDLRISRTARYVAPFTPPSEPFPVA